MSQKRSIENLEALLQHSFDNRALLQDALTHSSTGNEKNYERLEFLGDRVLGLIVAEMLYQKFPAEPEGDLAKRLSALVQGKLLAKVAAAIDLGEYVEFSDAERQAGGAQNENILADVFEAVIGALYLDAGFKKCHAFVEAQLADSVFEMKAPPQHPKTALQEWVQAKGLGLPVYEVIKQHGPDHMPIFDVQLSVEGYTPVVAHGPSRQKAEKIAAQTFLASLAEKGEAIE